MGATESKLSVINLIFPSHGMPFTIPFSEVPELAERIGNLLKEMIPADDGSKPSSLKSPRALYPDHPKPNDWVLVDIAKASIICKPFLVNFLVPGGDYMVMSMRSSAISETELVEKVRILDMKRQTDYSQTRCLEPPVRLRFPSHGMPFLVPFSVVADLGLAIDAVLLEMERTQVVLTSGLSKLQTHSEPIDLGRPRHGDWVLVDIAKATIIHKPFLEVFVVANGDYMVLPMRASVLSEAELVEKVKSLGFERQASRSQAGGLVPEIRLLFPSHGMPFVIPFSAETVLQFRGRDRMSIINHILQEMVANGHSKTSSSPTTDFSCRRKANGQTLECPLPNDWILADTVKALVIHKAFLDTLVVPNREYMVLPARASISAKDIKEATKAVVPRGSKFQQPILSPSMSCGGLTAWSPGTRTQVGSVCGGEGVDGYVQLVIKRADLGKDVVQCYSISRTWTINLLMVSLNTGSDAKLIESIDGFVISYPRASRQTLEDIGWGSREGRIEVSVIV